MISAANIFGYTVAAVVIFVAVLAVWVYMSFATMFEALRGWQK